jgi:Domain of unknown function (DUF4249)
MSVRYNFLMLFPLLLFGIYGCDGTREVDLDLPDYESQLVVECFLEVGSPMYMILSESIGFQDSFATPFVAGATVVITHRGLADTLRPFASDFLYLSEYTVPPDYDVEYQIEVRDTTGRVVRGSTRVMPPVRISSMTASYNKDSAVAVTVNWPDPPGQDNYYRFALYKGKIPIPGDVSEESTLQFDFTLDDLIGDGRDITVGTFFDYRSGDTLIASLYHISQSYWNYLNSLDDAASSNGNPFAQPGVIRSNVTGGLGCFTGYAKDLDTLIIP